MEALWSTVLVCALACLGLAGAPVWTDRMWRADFLELRRFEKFKEVLTANERVTAGPALSLTVAPARPENRRRAATPLPACSCSPPAQRGGGDSLPSL